ncbi:MAG: RNA polymerase sigma factor, partial [Bdellovibrionales bacterium]
EVKGARRELLLRYSKPVYSYLRSATKYAESADELYQEFALRFVRGDFQRAHPTKGKFRGYLKTALHHLIADFYRNKTRQPGPLPQAEIAGAEEESWAPASELEYYTSWRGELLNRAWLGLEAFEKETGQPLHTVLRCRTDHPNMQSPQLATHLTTLLGMPITAGWVRKRIHFARRKFTELLTQEVCATLDSPTPELIKQELGELGLLEYCEGFLEEQKP